MKIAIAANGDQVSSHFGHCMGFTLYEVGENQTLTKSHVENPGHRPGFLPVFLKDQGVNVILSGGMGGAAQELFVQNNIEVIVGLEGKCDAVMEEYLQGKVKSSGTVCHEHQYESSCGSSC